MTKKSSLQSNRRLRKLSLSIAGARTGSALVTDQALNWLLPSRKTNYFLEYEAKRLAAELGRLKGTYVKIGQMLALMGTYILPKELVEALRGLESEVKPLSWKELEAVVRQRLGDRFDELDIDPNPLAAASLAQVHRARVIATGEEICLKILYPGVEETIADDFDTVSQMLMMSRWIKTVQNFDAWLGEVRDELLLEVDYRRELKQTQQVAKLLADDSRYVVPQMLAEYSGDHILAMEYLQGDPVTSEQVRALAQADRNQLGKSMLDLFFLELYRWRLMQSDPNFGNYRIRVTEQGVQLVLLDFGSVIALAPEFAEALGRTISHGQQGDRAAVAAGLRQLKCLDDDAGEQATETFVNFCMLLLEPLLPEDKLLQAGLPEECFSAEGVYRWKRSKLIKRAGKLATQYSMSREFKLPPKEFTFLAKKLTGVFTFISELDAEFNGAEILAPYQDS